MNKKIILLLMFVLTLVNFSAKCDETKTITITKEDIINANPTKAPVDFDKKDRKAVEIMEKRHFTRTYPEFSDFDRLKNLEYELLGRIWLYTDQKDRIERLKLASSNRMLKGTALPPSLSSRKLTKRMRNDMVDMRQTDDVGLIDGFLRLLAPKAYEQYRQYSDNKFFKYEDEY